VIIPLAVAVVAAAVVAAVFLATGSSSSVRVHGTVLDSIQPR
jgi:hypothetical protein